MDRNLKKQARTLDRLYNQGTKQSQFQRLSLLAQIRTFGGSLLVVMLISFASSMLHSEKDWKNAFVMVGWISGAAGSVLSIAATTQATLIREDDDQ